MANLLRPSRPRRTGVHLSTLSAPLSQMTDLSVQIWSINASIKCTIRRSTCKLLGVLLNTTLHCTLIRWTWRDSAPITEGDTADAYRDHCFTVNRQFDTQNPQIFKTTIHIKNPHLKSVLETVIGQNPSANWTVKAPLVRLLFRRLKFKKVTRLRGFATAFAARSSTSLAIPPCSGCPFTSQYG